MKLVILGAALIVTLCVVALLYRRRRLNLIRNRVGKYRAVLDNTVIFDDNGKPGLSPLELLKLSQIDKDSFVMGEGLLALTTWSENQRILFQSSAWQSDKHKVLKLSIENGKHEYIDGLFALSSPSEDSLAVYSKDGWLRIHEKEGGCTDIERVFPPSRFIKIPIPVFPSQIAWSPDGDKLAFTYRKRSWLGIPQGAFIKIYYVKTSHTKTVLEVAQGVSSLSWLSDGQRLVFSQGSDDQLNAEISILNITTDKVESLVTDAGTTAFYLTPSSAPSAEIVSYHYDPIQHPPVVHGFEIAFVNAIIIDWIERAILHH